MAITKTGVTLTSSGENDRQFEKNGQQSSIEVNALTANKTYTVSAYVVDSAYGTITSASTTNFTTMQAGTANLVNNSAWSGDDVDIRVNFTMTYPIDSVKILNAKTEDFSDPVIYTAATSGTTSGTINSKISKPLTYVMVYITDFYGEEFKSIFNVNDLP